MPRVKLSMPDRFSFSTVIPIRITDLNYGGHVGNDRVLSLLHEVRMQYLRHYGYTEMDLEGCSLIMSDVAIEFKAELFYGDVVEAFVQAEEFSRVGFELYYRLQKQADGTAAALAKTGMVCFNYKQRKVAAVPEAAIAKLQS